MFFLSLTRKNSVSKASSIQKRPNSKKASDLFIGRSAAMVTLKFSMVQGKAHPVNSSYYRSNGTWLCRKNQEIAAR